MGQPLPGMALVVSNGRVMAALRRGHPLSVGLVDGLTTCSRCEIGPAANELNPRVKSHRMLRAAMVLSGAAAPIDGFRDVAEREVIAIPRTLTEIRSL
jgi:glutamine amidotransferase